MGFRTDLPTYTSIPVPPPWKLNNEKFAKVNNLSYLHWINHINFAFLTPGNYEARVCEYWTNTEHSRSWSSTVPECLLLLATFSKNQRVSKQNQDKVFFAISFATNYVELLNHTCNEKKPDCDHWWRIYRNSHLSGCGWWWSRVWHQLDLFSTARRLSPIQLSFRLATPLILKLNE